ncbi:hypothetical protein OIO90_001251 [Microbotryomycetes sp. JL221]|nr:hypothetical protein OIO90_001251 [Microbotryomycetes sp. JL221]
MRRSTLSVFRNPPPELQLTSEAAQWTHVVGSVIALLSLCYACTYLPLKQSTAGRRGWAAPFAPIPNPFPDSSRPSVQVIDVVGFMTFFLDYLGIVVLISGTFVPAVRYGFFCDPHLQTFYITLIYVAGAGTAYTVLAPHARTPEYRRFRAWVFIALGLSALFPVGHALIRYGLSKASDSLSLPWLALGGFLYIFGAVLYAERVPERYKPGRFDILGSSHQIFHVLILLAAWCHWCAIAEGYRFWHEERAGVCWKV